MRCGDKRPADTYALGFDFTPIFIGKSVGVISFTGQFLSNTWPVAVLL